MVSPISLSLSLVIATLLSQVRAVLPITVVGNKFYQLQEDWTQPPESFSIVGVNYQPGGTANFDIDAKEDTLSNGQICQRDAFLLRQLGVNTIHVSAASPWINHDQCMTILNNAGIYVVLDVNLPDSEIDPNNPSGTYDHSFLNNAFGLVDAFKYYPNFIGFVAGDSIVNSSSTAAKDPKYVRSLIRDLKQYIDRWANRTIPVGYWAGSDPTWRYAMYEYLQCDASSGNATVDSFSRADFIGLQDFTWCGDSDWESSDYGDVLRQYNSSSIPVIFSSYGCKGSKPRTFNEVDEGLYGPLGDVLSGGFVYEYSDDTNYGLVSIDQNENVSLKPDFENFKTAVAAVTYKPSTLTSTAATGTAALTAAPTCNSDLLPKAASGFSWQVTSLPPCPASDLLISNGGNYNVGKVTDFPSAQLTYTWALIGVNNTRLSPTYTYASSYQVNYQTNVPASARKTVLPYGSTAPSAQPTSTSSTNQVTGSATSPTSSGSSAAYGTMSALDPSSLTNEGGKKKTNGASSTQAHSLSLLVGATSLVSLLFVLM